MKGEWAAPRSAHRQLSSFHQFYMSVFASEKIGGNMETMRSVISRTRSIPGCLCVCVCVSNSSTAAPTPPLTGGKAAGTERLHLSALRGGSFKQSINRRLAQ